MKVKKFLCNQKFHSYSYRYTIYEVPRYRKTEKNLPIIHNLLLGFSADTKDEFSEMIEEIMNLYNKNLEKNEYLFRKNDIITDALERGLKDMKANLPKK